MHHSPSPRLPDHVRKASWIDPADVDWLSAGFQQMEPALRTHVIDVCFTRQRQRIFHLMTDDPVGAELLRMYIEDDMPERSAES